jgi:hypothetical protein
MQPMRLQISRLMPMLMTLCVLFVKQGGMDVVENGKRMVLKRMHHNSFIHFWKTSVSHTMSHVSLPVAAAEKRASHNFEDATS